jgi:hypothetical protein
MGLPIQSAPKYSTVLPSDGREVEFRPFLVKEQKALVLAREAKDTNQSLESIKTLIRAVTFDKVEPNDIPMIDLEWLFIKIRSVSVGETVNLKLVCDVEDCNGTGDVTVDLEEIKVVGEMPEEGTVMISDTVGVTLSMIKVKDIKGIDKLKQDEQIFEILKRSIVTVFDEENVYVASDISESDLNEFIDSLTLSQLQLLGQFFDDAPKLSHTVSYKCNLCGEESTKTLEGLQSFF